MLRQLVCGLVAATLFAGFCQAGEKKAAKNNTTTGTFASFKDGTLTIKVQGQKGDEPKPQDFKVAGDLKVTMVDGDDKKEVPAKDAFQSVKEGTAVVVTLGEGDKVTAVVVGKAKKKAKAATVSGAFVSAKEGTLTLKVKGKKGDEPTAKEFKVADDVKATVFTGNEKKEATAKEAFKDAKEGTLVALTLGTGDKVTAVQVGKPEKKNK